MIVAGHTETSISWLIFKIYTHMIHKKLLFPRASDLSKTS